MQDRVMAENNDLKVEVENLRTEVALLSPPGEGEDKMEEDAVDCRPITRSQEYVCKTHS